MKKIHDRLKRIEGQVRGVDAAIANGASCHDVVPQLLAIKGAVGAVTEQYLTTAITECVDTADTKNMQQLIKTLIQHS